MTYEAIGLITKLPYVTGTKEDCLRELNEKYPYPKNESDKIYPEPLKIIRRKR